MDNYFKEILTQIITISFPNFSRGSYEYGLYWIDGNIKKILFLNEYREQFYHAVRFVLNKLHLPSFIPHIQHINHGYRGSDYFIIVDFTNFYNLLSKRFNYDQLDRELIAFRFYDTFNTFTIKYNFQAFELMDVYADVDVNSPCCHIVRNSDEACYIQFYMNLFICDNIDHYSDLNMSVLSYDIIKHRPARSYFKFIRNFRLDSHVNNLKFCDMFFEYLRDVQFGESILKISLFDLLEFCKVEATQINTFNDNSLTRPFTYVAGWDKWCILPFDFETDSTDTMVLYDDGFSDEDDLSDIIDDGSDDDTDFTGVIIDTINALNNRIEGFEALPYEHYGDASRPLTPPPAYEPPPSYEEPPPYEMDAQSGDITPESRIVIYPSNYLNYFDKKNQNKYVCRKKDYGISKKLVWDLTGFSHLMEQNIQNLILKRFEIFHYVSFRRDLKVESQMENLRKYSLKNLSGKKISLKWDLSGLPIYIKKFVEDFIFYKKYRGIVFKNGVRDIQSINTKKERSQLITALRDLKLREQNQMFAQAFDLVSKVTNSIDRTKNFIYNLEIIPENINRILTQVSDTISNLSYFSSALIQQAFKFFILFLVFIILLHFLGPMKLSVLIVLLETAIVFTTLTDVQRKTVTNLILAYVGLTASAMAPLNNNTMVAQAFDISVLPKLLLIIPSILFIGVIPTDKKIDKFISRLDSVPRAIAGIDKIWTYISDFLPKIESFIYMNLLGIEYSPRITDLKPVDDWINLCDKYSKLDMKVLQDLTKAEVIEMSSLYSQGLHLGAQCAKEHWGSQIQLIIGRYLILANSLKDLAVSTGYVCNEKMRDQPLAIVLCGLPGTGKSYLTKYIPTYFMAKQGFPAESIIPNIYNVNTDNEFWDSYQDQFCVVFDDFGQKVDTTQNPNLDYFEFLRCVNTNTYPLHMANLMEKGKTYFNSHLVLASTNMPNLTSYIHSINEKNALHRRVDFSFYVTIKPQYRVDPDESLDQFDINNSSKVKLDITKIDINEPNLDIWEFYKYDVLSGVIEKNLKYTYSQICEIMLDRFNLSKDKALAFNNNITNYAKSLISQNGDLIYAHELNKDTFPVTVDLIESMNYEGLISSHELIKYSYDMEVDHNAYMLDQGLVPVERPLAFDQKIFLQIKLYSNNLYSFYTKIKSKIISLYENITTKYPILSVVFKYGSMILGGLTMAFTLFNLFKKDEKEDFSNSLKLKSEHESDFKHVPDCYRYLIKSHYKIYQLNSNESIMYFKAPLTCKYCSGRRYAFFDEFPRCLDCRNIFDSLLLDNCGKTTLYNNGVSKYSLPVDIPTKFSKKHTPFIPHMISQDNERAPLTSRSINALVANNLFCVEFSYGNEWVQVGNCLFIKGHVGLFFRHAFYIIDKRKPIKLRFTNTALKHSFELFTGEVNFIDTVDETNRMKEIVFITIPNNSIRFRDITKHFISKDEISKIPNNPTEISGALLSYDIKSQIVNNIAFNGIYKVDSFKLTSANGVFSPYFVHNNLYYSTRTIKGDCGAPLVLDNVYFTGSIVGIHIAGDERGIGAASIVTKEFIDKYLEKIPKLTQMIWRPEAIDELEAENYVEINNLPNIPPGDFIPLAKTSFKLSQSPINKIIPSAFHNQISIAGELKLNKKLPSILGSTIDSDGNKVDMLLKGLSKMGNSPFRLDQHLVDQAKDSYLSKIIHLNPEWSDRRILTPEEAIKGVENSLYSHGCNRKSSMGFPYNIPGKQKPGGKKLWFGEDEWKFDSPMAKELLQKHDKIWHDYKTLQNSHLFVCTDLEKMEKLPIEKIRDQKTRVFAGGNMDFQVLFNVLFGSFLNMMKKNAIDIESCVGMNVYSMHADKLVKQLLSKGDSMLAGDFSRFDATVNSQILYAVVQLINEWYDDEYSDMRLAVAMDIINSVHISRDSLYMWTHSQPSGQPATAEFNCLFTSLAIRIVVQLIAPYPVEFNKLFEFKTYGDDTIISFNSTKYGSWFNYETVSKGFEEIGMDYTEETKTSGFSCSWKTIDEISFLKRHFKYDVNTCRWIMPLFKDTIIETIYWHERKQNQTEQLIENCRNSLAEASLHGEDYYNELAKEIRRLSAKYSIKMDIPPFLYFYCQRQQDTLLEGLWNFDLNDIRTN